MPAYSRSLRPTLATPGTRQKRETVTGRGTDGAPGHLRRRQGRRAARRHDRAARSPDDARVLRARRAAGPNRRGVRPRGRHASRADRAEEVLPHGRQFPRARGRVEAGRVVAPDRALDHVLPERGRDRWAGRAGRLSGAPDRRARLRAGAGGRDPEGGEVVRARGGDGARRRLRDLQRHHGSRHPAARDGVRRVLVLQGNRHLLPARPLDRHARRDRRPARPRNGAAGERRAEAALAQREHVGDDPGDPGALLRPWVLGGRRALDRDGLRRGRVQPRRGRPLPEARRRDGGGDRADRGAAEPGGLLAGGAWRAGAGARSLVRWERDDAKLERVRALMADHELDALVVRAPDNVLYLTNFWGMKGYDACVFPREGDAVLICLEASQDDALDQSWTTDIRLVDGYSAGDPRPVPARTLDAALEAANDYGRV